MYFLWSLNFVLVGGGQYVQVQQRAEDPKERELKELVRCPTWGLGPEARPCARSASALNHWALSPAPRKAILNSKEQERRNLRLTTDLPKCVYNPVPIALYWLLGGVQVAGMNDWGGERYDRKGRVRTHGSWSFSWHLYIAFLWQILTHTRRKICLLSFQVWWLSFQVQHFFEDRWDIE